MRRARLDVHAHQALLAGRYQAMRDHWMRLAREVKRAGVEKDRPSIGFYAGLARSAHRAYCTDLTRALQFQRQLADRRFREAVAIRSALRKEAGHVVHAAD